MKEIPLTQGKVALVDDEDYGQLTAYSWHAIRHSHTWYAGRTVRFGHGLRVVLMHRQIMDAANNQHIDHKNGEGLDNQKGNLRIATQQENLRNKTKGSKFRGKAVSSRYKGVCWDSCRKKWQASVVINRRRVYFRRFDNEQEAALAYDIAALKYFGEFARLNFPDRVKAA